jgi:SAM-dependent methyltransferase
MHAVTSTFGRDVVSMPEVARRNIFKHAFRFWRSEGFPFQRLSSEDMTAEYDRLCRVRPEQVLVGDQATTHTAGLRLANYFHPQMWSIRRRGRSALEVFDCDESLQEILRKCVQFYPHRRCWNAQCLRSVLRLYHGARVANFRPAVARSIYQKFSSDEATILDFSAGFGGRMLGALTLKRHYIGIDPANEQIHGLKQMSQRLSKVSQGTVRLLHECAEVRLPRMPAESVDLVLSSPPYFDNERYSGASSQSCVRFPTYEEWKHRFLAVIITECHRVLRPGGSLLLNVSNVRGAPVAEDAAQMGSRLFLARPPIQLLLRCLPNSSTQRTSFRSEPILVLQKRRKMVRGNR